MAATFSGRAKILAPVILGFGAQTFKTFAIANPICDGSALTVVRTRTEHHTVRRQAVM